MTQVTEKVNPQTTAHAAGTNGASAPSTHAIQYPPLGKLAPGCVVTVRIRGNESTAEIIDKPVEKDKLYWYRTDTHGTICETWIVSSPMIAWDMFKRDNAVVEIRALLKTKDRYQPGWDGWGDIVTGWFDDYEAFYLALKMLERYGKAKSIYTTLNPVSEDLAARAYNRLIAVEKDGQTTQDQDITRRCHLLLDADPIRPSGVSATDAELEAACARMEEAEQHLTRLGWPEPIRARSGNGPHRLYPISLPNDDASRDLIAAVLNALQLQFGDKEKDTDLGAELEPGQIGVKIDTSVYNASRITKGYGSTAKKGDDVPARPHRPSYIESVPTQLVAVTRAQLEEVAAIWISYEAALKAEEEKKREEAKAKRRDETGDDVDVIAQWKELHDLEDTLTKYSYPRTKKGNRWDDPRGEGSNSILVDKRAQKAYAFSPNAPVHNGHRFDSFDLFTTHEHNGDRSKAFIQAKKDLDLWTEPRTVTATDPNTGEPVPLSKTKGPSTHVNGKSSKTATAPATASDTQTPGEYDGDEGTEKPKKPKVSVLLYRLAVRLADFFVAQDGEAYALIPVDERVECHKLRTKMFCNFLTNAFYEDEETIPGASALQEALSLLEWKAQEERREVFVRVASHNGKIYIDLGNADWEAVEVDSAGWRIVKTPPVAFRRSRATAELPRPTQGSSLDAIRDMINIDPNDWPLVGTWLLAVLQPTGPYPVLCLVGEQGSAKSTTVRTLKELVDPSVAGLRGQPEDIRDLMIAANNNWLLAYDNISYLSNDISDALCRLSTGGGYAKRSLYTDDEEFIIDATRPVVMNGITEIINRPDLLDRAILIELPIVSSEKRQPEREYWAKFEEQRPALFGALLDALSFALGSLPFVQLERLPRMADFAKLGTAAWGMFCPDGDKTFVDLYGVNREQGTEGVVESSPLTGLLKSLVAIDGKWTGTPTELLEKLEQIATDRQKEAKGWPAAPNKLTAELKRLAPSLRQSQVVDARHYPIAGRRLWHITRMISG